MKKYILFCCTISLLVLVNACKKSDTPAKLPEVNLSATQKAVLSSSNSFGWNLLKDLGATLPVNQNLFISPLSVSLALTMTYNGAGGNTGREMKQTLGYQQQSQADINQACKELMQLLLNLDPKVTMEIANSIWYRNTFSVKNDFLNLNKNYFNAEVNSADFNDPNTVAVINNWVNNKTHAKISSILDQINPDVVMYLINAIYFKGSWQYMFDKTKTSSQNFLLTDGSAYSTDFMTQECSLKYMSDDLFSAVELPYGNGYFSMVVMLPTVSHTTSDLINSITDDNWKDWNNALIMHHKVKVSLPKFTTKSDLNLNSNLIHLGMKDAFDPDHADFSGIDGLTDLYITNVKHKSFVEINEEGTEAAAVTSVEVSATSAGPGQDNPIIFFANKPFVFVIKENTTNSVLFSGIIQKPVMN